MGRQVFGRDAFWALVAQALSVLVLSGLVGGLRGVNAAGSWFVGGLVCILPSLILYRRVFAQFGASKAKAIVKAFYLGEALKFILTGVGFVAAFQIPWLQPLWLFLGFLAAQAAFWLSPIIISLRRKQRIKTQ